MHQPRAAQHTQVVGEQVRGNGNSFEQVADAVLAVGEHTDYGQADRVSERSQTIGRFSLG